MSRNLSGGGHSGGSRSFGGSSRGGSRSFGGSSPNHSTRRVGGSSSSSSGSSGGFSGDSAGLIVDLLFLGLDLMGLPGLIIVGFCILLVYLGTHYPMIFGIALTIGLVLLFVWIFISSKRKKKDENYPFNIVDILADGNKKYDTNIIYNEDFTRYMLSELSDRNLLTRNGNIQEDKIDIAVNSFDEIYRKYNSQPHYLRKDI